MRISMKGELALISNRIRLAAAVLLAGAWLGASAHGADPVASDPRSGDAVGADVIAPPVTDRFAVVNEETPSFQRHVGPLFGRLGCNGRSCHGSFQGRGGFRLSLFGYDFIADHAALLDEESPRIDLKDAAASLILNKPTSDDEHEGGKRFEDGGWEYQLLRQWVAAGAPFDAQKVDKLVDLRITPDEIRFRKGGERLRLRVVAVWEDGSREDVTPLCRFQSNDDLIVKVDQDGWLESGEAGDTHVVVFYDKAVKPLAVIQPVTDLVGDRYPAMAMKTRVDELVVEKLRKLGIVPSSICSDEEFLRRVTLDLTGTLPTAAQARAFLADPSSDKRERWIDQLLKTPAYAAWWTTKLCDFTGNNDDQLVNVTPGRGQAGQQWYDWIYERVADNVAYDDLVEGIVTASSKKPGQSYEEYCREMSELFRDENKSFADMEHMTHYWARRDFRMPPETRDQLCVRVSRHSHSMRSMPQASLRSMVQAGFR